MEKETKTVLCQSSGCLQSFQNPIFKKNFGKIIDLVRCWNKLNNIVFKAIGTKEENIGIYIVSEKVDTTYR